MSFKVCQLALFLSVTFLGGFVRGSVNVNFEFTHCTNTGNHTTCSCNAGFTGNGTSCSDIDECASRIHNCAVNADCTNTQGSYTCACKPGYTGDGRSCTDIDECASRIHNCAVNADCINTPGSFACECKPGYIGDGRTSCTDIDECASRIHNCAVNADCINRQGSFTCACKPGYTGDGRSCTDINECSSGTHDCDVNSDCTNTLGSFTCACKLGYTGDGKICTDLNECVVTPSICHDSAVCKNLPGSYTCTCQTGYTAGDGGLCIDIDECANGNTCSTRCVNTQGSYYCECDEGYLADKDRKCIKAQRVLIMLKIYEKFLPGYIFSTTPEYAEISQRILDAITEVYVANKNFWKAEVIRFSQGSVLANIWLYFTGSGTISLVELTEAVYEKQLKGLSVNDDSLTILYLGSCPAVCPSNSECNQASLQGYYTCDCNSGYNQNGTECAAFIEVQAEIVVLRSFTNDLKDNTSLAYKVLEAEVISELRKVFNKTEYFVDVVVIGFTNGSVNIDFIVLFRRVADELKQLNRKVVVAESLSVDGQDGYIGNLQLTGNINIKEPPPSPKGVTSRDETKSQLVVAWQAPDQAEYFSITHYVITYRTLSGQSVVIETIAGTENSQLVDNLESDTFYVITLHGRNNYGHGDKSKEIQVKTSKESKDNTVLIIVVVVVIVVLLFVAFVILMICLRRRKERQNVLEMAMGPGMQVRTIPPGRASYENSGQQ